MAKPEILVAPVTALAEILTARFTSACAVAIDSGRAATVALTGGSTINLLGDALVRASVEWNRTQVFWGDERAVPPDSLESNYNMAQAVVLDRVAIPASHVHRMPADIEDLDAAARRYEATLTAHCGPGASLDLALLGVGPDGHVCSLFPGHPLLDERHRLVAPVYDSPKPPRKRLTLTLPTLAAARLLIIVAIGPEKSGPIREAVHNPVSALPVSLVTRTAQAVLFLLDPAAGASLDR
jgi:6-phosphogluconolactonase